jgi:hypothetical protein
MLKPGVLLLVSALLLGLVPGLATGAEPLLPSIYVVHHGKDAVGMSFAFKLKEQIRTSASFRLANTADKAAIKVMLASLDPSPSDDGLASAISVTFISTEDRYLGSQVVVCGRKSVDEMASQVIAAVDSFLAPLLEDFYKKQSKKPGRK